MIKSFHFHQLGSLITKYATIQFLEIFRERKLIFKEGDEFLIETKDKEYQAYYVIERGELVKSDIYKQKQRNEEK